MIGETVICNQIASKNLHVAFVLSAIAELVAILTLLSEQNDSWLLISAALMLVAIVFGKGQRMFTILMLAGFTITFLIAVQSNVDRLMLYFTALVISVIVAVTMLLHSIRRINDGFCSVHRMLCFVVAVGLVTITDLSQKVTK